MRLAGPGCRGVAPRMSRRSRRRRSTNHASGAIAPRSSEPQGSVTRTSSANASRSDGRCSAPATTVAHAQVDDRPLVAGRQLEELADVHLVEVPADHASHGAMIALRYGAAASRRDAVSESPSDPGSGRPCARHRGHCA